MATIREDIKVTDGGIKVGANTAPDTSAVLDLQSTTKGMLAPRMTTAEKNAITSPAEGLVIFDTDLDCLCQYTGSAWEKLSTKTELDAHINSTTAHTAANIVNVPSGDLAATNVQAALDELQTDVNTRATSASLTAHTSATSAHGVSGAVVGTTDAQVITNKDIDGGTASNTSRMTLPKADLATLTALTRKEGTLVYATDLDKPYFDNGTDLEPWGSGSGGGAASYVENNNFEEGNVTGWSTYADAAASTPADGTGGTATSTFAINSTTPMYGTYDAVFTKPASNEQGEGFSNDFTIDNDLRGKPVNLRIPTNVSSGYVSADMGYYVYNVTDGTMHKVGDITGSGDFVGSFIATQSTSYRLIAHVQSTSAVAYTVNVDDVFVGKQEQVNAAAVTDWQSFTGSITNAPGTFSGKWRRVGDSMEVDASLTLSGAVTGLISMTLPNSAVIDTSKIPTTSSSANILGVAHAGEVTGGRYYLGGVVYDGSSSVRILDTDTAAADYWRNAVPFTWANTDLLSVNFKVPIVGWSSNTTMANRALEEFASNSSTSTTTSDTTSFAYGPSGSLIGNVTVSINRRVRFQTPIQSNDSLVVEVSSDRVKWFPVNTGSVVVGGANVQNINLQGSIAYGIGRFTPVSGSTTDVDVLIAQYAASNGATYGGVGEAWSSGGGSGYWRVRKVSGGALVGYPIGARNIVGDTSGTAVPSRMIGEIKTQSYTGTFSQSSPTLATWYDATGYTFEVPAGQFFISSNLPCEIGAPGAGQWYMEASLRDASNNIVWSDIVGFVRAGENGFVSSIRINAEVNNNAATTYKVSIRAVGYSGSPSGGNISVRQNFAHAASIKARRVA